MAIETIEVEKIHQKVKKQKEKEKNSSTKVSSDRQQLTKENVATLNKINDNLMADKNKYPISDLHKDLHKHYDKVRKLDISGKFESRPKSHKSVASASDDGKNNACNSMPVHSSNPNNTPLNHLLATTTESSNTYQSIVDVNRSNTANDNSNMQGCEKSFEERKDESTNTSKELDKGTLGVAACSAIEDRIKESTNKYSYFNIYYI
jgi:hypothetical protein